MVERLSGDLLTSHHQEFYDIALLGTWDWNISKNQLFWSDKVFSIFGTSQQQFKERYESFLDFVHPDDRADVKAAVTESIEFRSFYQIVHRIVRPDGQERMILQRAQHFDQQDGHHMKGTVLDITNVTQADKEGRKQAQRSHAINRITKLLMDNKPLGKLMEKALQIIFELDWLDIHHRGMVFLANPDTRRLQVIAQHGLDGTAVLTNCDNIAYGYCLCGRLAASDKDEWLASCLDHDHDFVFDGMEDHGHLIFKIKKDQTLVGILNLYNTAHQKASPEDVSFLRTVANTLSGIIEIKTLESMLKERADHYKRKSVYDALTGLPNRAFFEERIKEIENDSRRYDKKFSILYIDLNDFKKVNDEIGHDAGDHILVEFSRILNEVARDSDSCCRLGGDEFVALLPETNRDMAEVLANRVVDGTDVDLDFNGHKLKIKLSIGIATYPDHGEDGKHILKAADEMMYKAKKKVKKKKKRALVVSL
ncbi:MAG: diguanylate cyclase [Magnetococcales bacterium]|nr:diguanylate cyclase [Magnetococcales bacterium]